MSSSARADSRSSGGSGIEAGSPNSSATGSRGGKAKSLVGSKPKLPAKALQSAAGFFGGGAACSEGVETNAAGGGALEVVGVGRGTSPGSNPNSSANDFQGSSGVSVMKFFRNRVCDAPWFPALAGCVETASSTFAAIDSIELPVGCEQPTKSGPVEAFHGVSLPLDRLWGAEFPPTAVRADVVQCSAIAGGGR